MRLESSYGILELFYEILESSYGILELFYDILESSYGILELFCGILESLEIVQLVRTMSHDIINIVKLHYN